MTAAAELPASTSSPDDMSARIRALMSLDLDAVVAVHDGAWSAAYAAGVAAGRRLVQGEADQEAWENGYRCGVTGGYRLAPFDAPEWTGVPGGFAQLQRARGAEPDPAGGWRARRDIRPRYRGGPVAPW